MKNDWNMGVAYDLLNLKHGVLMLRYFLWGDDILNAAWQDKACRFYCTLKSLFLIFSGYFVEAGLVTVAASGLLSLRCGPSGPFWRWSRRNTTRTRSSTTGWRSSLPSTVSSLSRANILYVSLQA